MNVNWSKKDLRHARRERSRRYGKFLGALIYFLPLPVKHQSKLHPHLKLALGVVLIAVLVVIGGVVYWKKAHDPVVVCKTPILVQAGNVIDPTRMAAVGKLVPQIKQLPNYAKDVNCDYILTTYYISLSDYTDANASLIELKKVYNPKREYSPYLGNLTLKPNSLQDAVDFIHQQEQDMEYPPSGVTQ